MGPLGMRATEPSTCLARVGLEWSTDRPVLVAGVEFRPVDPGARISFDPFNARVASVGYEAYGSVLGAPLLLASGVIEWSFQFSQSQNGPIGSSMPVESDTVDLSRIARLPGLSEVRGLPRQPINGFVDYHFVTDESVELLAGRFPSLASPDVEFPLDTIGLRMIPAYSISVPTVAVQQIAGLDVSGAFTIQPVSRDGVFGTVVAGSLALPGWLSGFEGEFGVFIPVNGATRVDRLRVDIGDVDLGVVRFTRVNLTYDKGTDTWSGRVGVRLGAGSDPLGMDGSLSIVGGKLQKVGVTVTGLPIAIGQVATINSLGGALTVEPLGIRAAGTLGIGPMVSSQGNVAVADGELVIDEDEISLSGVVTVGALRIRDFVFEGVRVGDARVVYYWDGLVSISGTAQFFIDDAETWGIRGALRGGATGSAISLGGDVSVRLGPLVTLGGSAAISTKGWIACAGTKGLWFSEVRMGVSYDWGTPAMRLRGDECNTDEYQVPLVPGGSSGSSGRNASGGDDGFRRSVDVVAGERMVTFAIGGGGATVLGPDGTRIEVSGADQSTSSDPTDPRWFVVRQPGDTTAYVLIARPAAGTWTIVTSDGDASVEASVVSADSRPKDAPTQVLDPTSGPRPLSTLSGGVATPTDGGTEWPQVLVVLFGLMALLAGAIVVERSRSTD